jgi:hypothetical protein
MGDSPARSFEQHGQIDCGAVVFARSGGLSQERWPAVAKDRSDYFYPSKSLMNWGASSFFLRSS